MKTKENYWKLATYILIGMLIILLIAITIKDNKNILINGVKINEKDFNQVESFMNQHNSTGFLMCNIKTGECIKTQAIK